MHEKKPAHSLSLPAPHIMPLIEEIDSIAIYVGFRGTEMERYVGT
jgi:hypothetical protein